MTSSVITAGIDDSECALTAARWAARDAVIRGARLRMVHISNRDSRVAEGVADRILRENPGITLELVRLDGSPTKVLLDESARCFLTVIGATGAGRLSAAIFGSVAGRVAARGQGCIVIARPPAPPLTPSKPGCVVVGTDGSTDSDAAIGFAFEEAALRGAGLLAIHAWNDRPLKRALGSYPLEINADTVDEQQRRLLAPRLDDWGKKFPGVDVELRVVRGRLAPALLGTTHPNGRAPAQLLVIGDRGPAGVAGLFRPTRQAVGGRAVCSVAIVHKERTAPAPDPAR